VSEQIEPTELDDLRSRVAKQRIILAQNSVEITEQKRALAKADRANVHLKMTVTQLTQDLAVARRDRDLLQTMVNAQASRYAEVEASLAVAIEETRRAWNRIFKDNPELQVNRVSLAMVDDIVAILSRDTPEGNNG